MIQVGEDVQVLMRKTIVQAKLNEAGRYGKRLCLLLHGGFCPNWGGGDLSFLRIPKFVICLHVFILHC